MASVIIPNIYEPILPATFQWVRQDGNIIQAGETIVSFETASFNFELVAEESGVLHIIERNGNSVIPGAIIGFIEEEKSIWPPPPKYPAL